MPFSSLRAMTVPPQDSGEIAQTLPPFAFFCPWKPEIHPQAWHAQLARDAIQAATFL